MDVRISRSTIGGVTKAPPSKSYSHRAILAGGYSDRATIVNALMSADTRATIHAIEAFGATVDDTGDQLAIDGFSADPDVPDDVIDCANSGTTMRLVSATAALPDGWTVLTGDESLRSRPQGPLLDAIEELGGRAMSSRGNGRAPVLIRGPIEGGWVAMPGDVSSQYISALLMAGAITDRGIDIELTTALKSAPYVDVTIEVLDRFGVTSSATDSGFRVAGQQPYDLGDDEYTVPGDFSSMSYLLAAGALASRDEVRIDGAYPSAQGDRAIVDILDRMGARVDWDRSAGRISVRQSDLTGIEIDVGDTPDLLPTLAVVGAASAGTTRIVNCEHVRYKETDRVSAMAEALTAMGAAVTEDHDSLTIHGDRSELQGTILEGRGDHRIIMALAVAGLVADGTTTITGADHVSVSFPGFFDVLADLGATVDR